MTQSHPFLDPPSNGKCLDSKEAADEGLCQREACLGWGARGSEELRTIKLGADGTLLVVTKTALLSRHPFVCCADRRSGDAMRCRRAPRTPCWLCDQLPHFAARARRDGEACWYDARRAARAVCEQLAPTRIPAPTSLLNSAIRPWWTRSSARVVPL